VKRIVPYQQKKAFEKALAKSIEMAFSDPGPIWPFIKQNAQELDDDVIRAHIALYVNDFSKDLGAKGKQAIRILLSKAAERGIAPPVPEDIFFE